MDYTLDVSLWKILIIWYDDVGVWVRSGQRPMGEGGVERCETMRLALDKVFTTVSIFYEWTSKAEREPEPEQATEKLEKCSLIKKSNAIQHRSRGKGRGGVEWLEKKIAPKKESCKVLPETRKIEGNTPERKGSND